MVLVWPDRYFSCFLENSEVQLEVCLGSEAGRILLLCSSLIPVSRMLSKKKKSDEMSVNLGYIFERCVINEALRLYRTSSLLSIINLAYYH